MLIICVERFGNRTKNLAGWMGGWMDGWQGKEQSQQWLQKTAFLKWDCPDFLTMHTKPFPS